MMTDLFCTPEQGKRLKDLLPELTSEYYWIFDVDCIIGSYPFDKDHLSNGAQKIPALTLQELRDVALKIAEDSKSLNKFNELLFINTAPELAEWVIARLEKQQ
jgi:hypothetical protein